MRNIQENNFCGIYGANYYRWEKKLSLKLSSPHESHCGECSCSECVYHWENQEIHQRFQHLFKNKLIVPCPVSSVSSNLVRLRQGQLTLQLENWTYIEEKFINNTQIRSCTSSNAWAMKSTIALTDGTVARSMLENS